MSGQIVSREEWLASRKALLEKEKELTRARDALAEQRRRLPMVKVDKNYAFHGADGTTSTLDDLFAGCSQLIVYHFMFAPDADEGCRGCCHIGESLPDVRHLRSKDTNLVCVSRAPADKLHAFRRRNGWTWPWFSSAGSDFNYDMHATVDDAASPGGMLNFRSKAETEAAGRNWYAGDVPGLSVFLRGDEGQVYHTYSTFARGCDGLMPTLGLLDLTPRGRQIGAGGPAEFLLKDEYPPF